MDKLDAKILELLQGNGELSAAEIADRVGLSKAPCWRRIRKLQQDGIIPASRTPTDDVNQQGQERAKSGSPAPDLARNTAH